MVLECLLIPVVWSCCQRSCCQQGHDARCLVSGLLKEARVDGAGLIVCRRSCQQCVVMMGATATSAGGFAPLVKNAILVCHCCLSRGCCVPSWCPGMRRGLCVGYLIACSCMLAAALSATMIVLVKCHSCVLNLCIHSLGGICGMQFWGSVGNPLPETPKCFNHSIHSGPCKGRFVQHQTLRMADRPAQAFVSPACLVCTCMQACLLSLV